jgi:Cdc6-like AAA superfamily ATPase
LTNRASQLTPEDSQQLQLLLGLAFTPAAPIDKAAVFAGRGAELNAVIDAVNQRGQHAVIYGERGVGKTSLANVICEHLENLQQNIQIVSPRINCTVDDDFSSIWRKIFQQIQEYKQKTTVGFLKQVVESIQPMSDRLSGDVRPDDVRVLLDVIGTQAIGIIVIDEFDRCPSRQVSSLLADTIKMLSDHAVRATIILVGVADSVEQLVAEHRSIERALRQILMPRMTGEEIKEILDKGFGRVEMQASPEVVSNIVQLSQGLPHYAHLLGRECGRVAAVQRRRQVTALDLEKGIEESLNHVSESTKAAHHKAVRSAKKVNLFRQVLLACALAECDSLGFFAAAAVRPPLRDITRKAYDIPTFARHLKEFCSDKRGPVLQRTGEPHNYLYRFVNPLMQPYVVMEGVAEGLIDKSVMAKRRASR